MITYKKDWKVNLLKFLGVFLIPILIGFIYNISQDLIITNIIFNLMATMFLLGILLVVIISIITMILKRFKDKKIQSILNNICYFVVASMFCCFTCMFSQIFNSVAHSKASTGISISKYIYTEINSQLEDENIEILEDEIICFDKDYSVISINDKVITFEEFFKNENPNHNYYFVVVIEDNQIQYVLYSKEPIKDNQIKKYSQEEQYNMYENVTKQDISCYPYTEEN